LLLSMLGTLAQDAQASATDRGLVDADPCLAGGLATIERALHPSAAGERIELGSQCDGRTGSFAAALGAAWAPDWAEDFPLQPFESTLAARLLAGDVAVRALAAPLQPAWVRWQHAMQAERATPPSGTSP
jgi:hypothetical protein